MKITAQTADALKSDLTVVFALSEKDKTTKSKSGKPGSGTPLIPSFLKKADAKSKGSFLKSLNKEKFLGKTGQQRLFSSLGVIPADNLLVMGLGEAQKLDAEVLRKAAYRAGQTAQSLRAARVVIVMPEASLSAFDSAEALAEGFLLSTYKFMRYRKPAKDAAVIESLVLGSVPSGKMKDVNRGIERAEIYAEGVMHARDLVNTPAQDMTPVDLGKVAKKIKGASVRVYDYRWIKKMKMGAFLGVALGSPTKPPVFIEMHYKPKGKIKKKVALIGKGVTFDSGGLSLKPPKFMETMKDDMAGAAGVIGFMSLIARLKPQVEVWAFVAATENMPDGMAMRPGDVITSMSGKTIEVLNTDAEGRLTLADAVTYAKTKKPDYIVDIATLTGACLVALGDRYSAILTNDTELKDGLITAGKKVGEKMWELPLAEEYKEELKSPIADLKNVGGSYGGTINGALFIQEFVGDSKWAHIDIAGPAYSERPQGYESKGGTGVMVRTFAEFLLNL